MAHWIKPPWKRENAQRVAHVMLHVSTPEAANMLILKGFYHDMEHLHLVKDKKEPIHCLKCQCWGHMAKDCRENGDTCGTCAGNHRMNVCTAYKTYRCVNCGSTDHRSWGCKCPEFIQRCHDLDTNTPENQMPYFPTSELWTQVLLPPKPTGSICNGSVFLFLSNLRLDHILSAHLILQ